MKNTRRVKKYKKSTHKKSTHKKSKKGKSLHYFRGGDKELDRLNKINSEAHKKYVDCKNKYCGAIDKKIDAGREEYGKQLNKKCPEIEIVDDLECKKSECKNHMNCVNDFYKKSNYAKLSEQFTKCHNKNCLMKEKEMDQTFENANKYYEEQEKEKEKEKGKGFLNYFKWLKN